jgi:hypothetical protein
VIAAGLGKYKEDGSRQALDVKTATVSCSASTAAQTLKSTVKTFDHARGRDSRVITRAGAATGGKK